MIKLLWTPPRSLSTMLRELVQRWPRRRVRLVLVQSRRLVRLVQRKRRQVRLVVVLRR